MGPVGKGMKGQKEGGGMGMKGCRGGENKGQGDLGIERRR